jgi:tellurite resistance protein TerC
VKLFEATPYRIVRKLVIALIGLTVLLVGAAMIFLPGPAIIVIPVGLAILGTEFAWAKTLLRRLRKKAGFKTT